VPIYINGRFLSQCMTGVQRFATEIVKAMDRQYGQAKDADGVDIVLLCPPDVATIPDLRHLEVRRVGVLRGQLWEQIELPHHARDGILLSLASVGPVSHRRQVVAMHDASVYANPENFTHAFVAWYRFLWPLLGRRAARIVTVSKFSRQELARYGVTAADRIEVVPNGADHILSQPADPAIFGRHKIAPGNYVLSVGSLSPNKNFGLVAEAFGLLGRAGISLVVAGGVNRRIFAGHGQEALQRATFVGRVGNRELRALYEQALCFVFPSLYEGFGLPPIEAMACGCPTIVAKTSSLPEVCGDAVLYCDPSDAADLAAKIKRLMDDPATRADLKDRGRRHAERYTWERAARKMMDLVNGVAGRPEEISIGPMRH